MGEFSLGQSEKVFAVVRPYNERIRKRVFAFLGSLGLHLAPGQTCPKGTPDAQAAQWASSLDVDLLLIPFHLHQDAEGNSLDGINVVALLSEKCIQRARPILMPVSAFSASAGFPRRLEELRMLRPEAAQLVIPMEESGIGSPEVQQRILRAL